MINEKKKIKITCSDKDFISNEIVKEFDEWKNLGVKNYLWRHKKLIVTKKL